MLLPDPVCQERTRREVTLWPPVGFAWVLLTSQHGHDEAQPHFKHGGQFGGSMRLGLVNGGRNSQIAGRQPKNRPKFGCSSAILRAEFQPGFGTCPRQTTSLRRRMPHSKGLLYCHSLATGVHIAVTQSTTECYVGNYLEF